MNAADLQRLLIERFPAENETHEWKGWRCLRHKVSGSKGAPLNGLSANALCRTCHAAPINDTSP